MSKNGSGGIHPIKKAYFSLSGICFPIFGEAVRENVSQIFKICGSGVPTQIY
jgi:hypothetical protein